MTDFAAPARKYTGKLKIEAGPVPVQRWADKDRPSGAKGNNLRGERKPGVGKSHPD
jgi:hypothetical protein